MNSITKLQFKKMESIFSTCFKKKRNSKNNVKAKEKYKK